MSSRRYRIKDNCQLSWRLRFKKDKFGFQRVLQVPVPVMASLWWKGHMTVKLAFMPLVITSITTRVTRRVKQSSLNKAAGAHYFLIIHQPLVLSQLKDNMLQLERIFWLWWILKSRPFSQLPCTITEKFVVKIQLAPKNDSAKKLPAEHIQVVQSDLGSLFHTGSCAITLKRSGADNGYQRTGHNYLWCGTYQ